MSRGPPMSDKTESEAAEASGRNRRRFTRVALDAQVAVKLSSVEGGFESRLKDLSENGVFILTSSTRPIGTGLELTITVVEGAHSVRARGIVVHEVKPPEATAGHPAGIGVMFLEIHEGRESLNKMLEIGTPVP